MTPRLRRVAVAVAALLAAVRAQGALDLQLSLGGAYSRGDASSTGSPDVATTGWDFAGGLGATWTPLSPGLLSLSGAASYQDRRTRDFAASDRIQNLAYQGTVAVNPSPFQLSFSAARSQSDFTTESQTTQAGTLRADSYSGTFGFTAAGLPQVRAGWFHQSQDTYFTGAPETRADVDSLFVRAFHNVPTHGYSAAYGTSWSSGTRAQTNYQNHALSLSAQARPAPGITLDVSDTYYLRDPTVSDPTNPRIDANSLGIGLGYSPSSRLHSSLSYAYTRSLGQAPGTLDQESADQSLALNADYKLDSHWGLVGGVSATYGQARLGTELHQATGESAALGATWNRTMGDRESLTVNAGGSAGTTQPAIGTPQTSYGLGAGAWYTFPLATWDGSAGYTVSYNDGSGALLVSSLNQNLTATVAGSIWAGTRTSVRVQALSQRSSSPIAGVSYGRSLSLLGTILWSAWSATLSAGATDSLANDLAPGFADGLFLAPSFNNRSRYVTLTGTTSLSFHLSVSAALTSVWTDPAGGLATAEQGAYVSAVYTLGEWLLSLQDTFAYSSVASGPWTKSNSVFVRLGRSFSFHR
jgi:hypothetical protein